jgi:hypothetical protein
MARLIRERTSAHATLTCEIANFLLENHEV